MIELKQQGSHLKCFISYLETLHEIVRNACKGGFTYGKR